MKALLLAVLLLAISSPLQARTNPATTILARVTAYWGEDHWSRRGQSATGIHLRPGHCAVDPRLIPFGSQVVLPGETMVAVDTGTAVKSRRAARRSGRTPVERAALVVDKFFASKKLALAWMGAHPLFLPIKVLPPQRAHAIDR